MKSKLTVVIPALNEEAAIGSVVKGLRELCADHLREVIVVDDGSFDDTANHASQAGARVIRHPRNRGYGAALKTGIRAAETEYVLTFDSDGQHRAEDALRLAQSQPTADLVIGQRQGLGNSPLWRAPGKWLLKAMAQYLTQQEIPDLNSGFRLMRRDVVGKYLHLCPSGFSFSTTTTMALLTQGHEVAFFPIDARQRVGKSTVTVATGFETIILVLRIATLFNPLRLFVPASLVLGLGGVLWTLPYLLAGRGLSVGSMLAIVTAVLTFSLGLLCDQISQLRLERYE